MTSGAMSLTWWGMAIGIIAGFATGSAALIVGLPVAGALIGAVGGGTIGLLGGLLRGLSHGSGPSQEAPEPEQARGPAKQMAEGQDMSHVKGGHVAREMARRARQAEVGQGIS